METVPRNALKQVLPVLMGQVQELRDRDVLARRRLLHFRKACKLRAFRMIAPCIESAHGLPMFVSFRDVEMMEHKLRHGDFDDLVVQCCAISELWLRTDPDASDIYFTEDDDNETWIFDHAKTLEDIANLLHRLQFANSSHHLRLAREVGLLAAVKRVFQDSQPSWQEMMMLFRAAGLDGSYRLFPYLAVFLRELSRDMPKPALSLLLSWISDAVMKTPAPFGDYTTQRVILDLLKLGASPLIARENHHVLCNDLKTRLNLVDAPWWLRYEDAAAQDASSRATVLNRLLTYRWDTEFLHKLRQHTCCSQDATGSCKKKFSGANASLLCLAAQRLPQSDLDGLPPALKYLVAKHMPLKL